MVAIDESLTTAEGRRKAGRIAVQAQGATVTTGVCASNPATAGAAYYCGVVGAYAAGHLYDYTEKYGEQGLEKAYDWASDAGSTITGIFGDFGHGQMEINTPDFFHHTELGKAILQLPNVAEILAGQPPMSADETYALASVVYSGTVAMIRDLMRQWNKALDGIPLALWPYQSYDVESAAVIPVAPPDGTLGAYPYDFDKPGTTRAGSLRDALKSYVLLGIIAEDSFVPTLRIERAAWGMMHQDQTTPTKPSAPSPSFAWFWGALATSAALTLGACALAMPKRRS